MKYKFPYCIGVLGSVEHSDQSGGIFRFSLKAERIQALVHQLIASSSWKTCQLCLMQ